jgi:tetratricopeptide (TPR) repeat protein
MCNRAMIRIQRGEIDAGFRDAEEAIRLSPASRQAHYALGIALEYRAQRHERAGAPEAGDADRTAALRHYSRAIEIDPTFEWIWFNRGVSRMREANRLSALGRAEETSKVRQAAIADFSEAVRLRASFAEAFNNRGLVHLALGEPSRAMADFEKAVEANPKHASAWYNLASQRDQTGDDLAKAGRRDEAVAMWDSALDAYTTALSHAPDTPEYLNMRGNTHRAKGDRAKAAADYERALKVAPRDWPYRSRVERALRDVQPK